MTEHSTYQIICSMVVQDSNGRILIVREADSRVHGKINLPGGHLDPGETPAACAIREVAEETGLQVIPSVLLGIYQQNHGISFVFLGQSNTPAATRPGADILACEWLTADEIHRLPDAGMLRAKKLRAIVKDVCSGIHYPMEFIKILEKEDWEEP